MNHHSPAFDDDKTYIRILKILKNDLFTQISPPFCHKSKIKGIETDMIELKLPLKCKTWLFSKEFGNLQTNVASHS